MISPPKSTATLRATQTNAGEAFFVASGCNCAEVSRAASDAYAQIADALGEMEMEIVQERIFGSLSAKPAVMIARYNALRARGILPDTPVTYIQGHPPWGEGLAGVIVHTVSPLELDGEVCTIMDGDIPCGRKWRRNGAAFIVLQNIQGVSDGAAPGATPLLQARYMFDRAERILQEQGLKYRAVARTWFYLSDILEWYGAFNDARNAKYGEFGLMPEAGCDPPLLPASTGVEADTPQSAYCAMDLVAVSGHDGSHPQIKYLSNPHQQDAFRYGSAFSRGVLLGKSDVSLIHVSGTAAIDEAGKSLYPGDVRAQIDCTLDKIEDLIGQEGAKLEDICAATAFIKHPEFAAVFWETVAARGLRDFPCVCVAADVCRDELLFELEAVLGFNRRP